MTNTTIFKKKKRINGTVLFAVYALLLAALLLLYNAFFVQFYIPSESMNNTLQVNDRILVQKNLNSETDVKRGDIIVFTDPGGWLDGYTQVGPQSSFLVKRVLAVGGDSISCCDSEGRNIVNGTPVTENYITGLNKINFNVVVPDGYVWVEGDNREDSADSRYNTDSIGEGFIPLENIQGRTLALTWPLDRFNVF